jgi:hypothetical protein
VECLTDAEVFQVVFETGFDGFAGQGLNHSANHVVSGALRWCTHSARSGKINPAPGEIGFSFAGARHGPQSANVPCLGRAREDLIDAQSKRDFAGRFAPPAMQLRFAKMEQDKRAE